METIVIVNISSRTSTLLVQNRGRQLENYNANVDFPVRFKSVSYSINLTKITFADFSLFLHMPLKTYSLLLGTTFEYL